MHDDNFGIQVKSKRFSAAHSWNSLFILMNKSWNEKTDSYSRQSVTWSVNGKQPRWGWSQLKRREAGPQRQPGGLRVEREGLGVSREGLRESLGDEDRQKICGICHHIKSVTEPLFTKAAYYKKKEDLGSTLTTFYIFSNSHNIYPTIRRAEEKEIGGY